MSCAILPATCILCGSSLPHLSSVPICAACWAEFPVADGHICTRCGDRLNAPASGVSLCRTCRLAPPPFLRAVASGPYQGRMRGAIHALKYDHMQPAARRLGGMLAEAIATLAIETPGDMLVVPVPLHRSRQAQRGFNQAEALAVHAMAMLRQTHPAWRLTLAPSLLTRLLPTPIQAGLSARARRLNVRGAFCVRDAAAVAGGKILLIDDVFTTGATARAASLALLSAGADSVYVATLARASRLYPIHRGSDLFFEDFDRNAKPTDAHEFAPASNLFQNRVLSSHDQPSF